MYMATSTYVYIYIDVSLYIDLLFTHMILIKNSRWSRHTITIGYLLFEIYYINIIMFQHICYYLYDLYIYIIYILQNKI